jgi:hypothetical protein
MNPDQPQQQPNTNKSSGIQNNSTSEELSDVNKIREQFAEIANISDPLTREYQFALLEKEAEKAGLSAESYRRLFETYLRDHKFIPQYPPKWYVFKEWVEWSSKFPKAVLFKKILITTLEKGVLISLISGVLKFYWEAPQREKQREFQAWEIINGAKGQRGSGGRIEALEELNKNQVSLRYVILDEADLSGINLNNALLSNASFKSAQLTCVTRDDGTRECTKIRNSNLSYSNLQKVNLFDADFQKSKFRYAKMQGAKLRNTKLQGADFEKAELQNATFPGADLESANFIGAKNLTPEQIKSAKNWEKACYDPELRIKLGLPPENPDDCQK